VNSNSTLITKYANLEFANVIQNIILLHRMQFQELLFTSSFLCTLTKTRMNRSYSDKGFLILLRPFEFNSNAILCYNLSTFTIMYTVHTKTFFFTFIKNNKQFKINFSYTL